MPGTLAGIGLTANNNLNGQPLAGCKLYIYQAGGVVIQTAYADSALSVALSWPLLGDAYGRLPFMWLPDGDYRVRLTDSNDLLVYDYASIPAVGASSSTSGGGGTSVDSTALIQTGDVIWTPISGTRSGFVRSNGRTIGSASSGALERANSDCQSLYTFLWSNFANTLCAVSGGRGATAALDWAANKPIATIDMKNAVLGGLDDMGDTAAGRFANVPIITGGVTTPGSAIGEVLHTISTTEMPSHNHALTDPGHTHSLTYHGVQNGPDAGNDTVSAGTQGSIKEFTANVSTVATGITISAFGGGGAHNNVQRTVLGTFFQKL